MLSSRFVPSRRLLSSDELRLLRNFPVSFLSCFVTCCTCLSLMRYGASCPIAITDKLADINAQTVIEKSNLRVIYSSSTPLFKVFGQINCFDLHNRFSFYFLF